MTSAQIQALLQGPNISDSIGYTIKLLNTSFPSLQQVNAENALEDAIDEARAVSDSYNTQVRLGVRIMHHMGSLLRPMIASCIAREC